MSAYFDHSGEAAIQRAEALERTAEREQAERAQRAEQFLGDGWPEIPVLELVRSRPVQPSAPEFIDHEQAARTVYGECPECGEANRPRHLCPARR